MKSSCLHITALAVSFLGCVLFVGGLALWQIRHFHEKSCKRNDLSNDDNDSTTTSLLLLARSRQNGNDHAVFMLPNNESVQESRKFKTILSLDIQHYYSVEEGTELFTDLNCPVSTCRVTTNLSEKDTADMVLYFHEPFYEASSTKQVQAFYRTEPPARTKPLQINPGVINWTITYRHDSTIPFPYGKWIYFDPQVKQKLQTQNYAMNKTKKVAWFVTNCEARNNRMEYAVELQKYIQVDVYGDCGTLKCPRDMKENCFDILDQDYKFYLAFENSNCKEYITEKLFENSLMRNILPVVMGAPREDYEKYAPFRSYIHVEDFESPEKLAEYLHNLDENDDLYNEYFKWKGTGEIQKEFFQWKYSWCLICAKLHDVNFVSSHKHYDDINEWWWAPGVCTSGFWRDIN